MSSKTIFILDDSALILEMATEALTSAGYTVRAAASLEQFEANAVKYKPDLVLLDINMPEVFGDDVATVLKSVRQWTVPIVLFSSVEHEELGRRAADAGAHGWISKRDGVDNMVARVSAILEGKP